MRVKTNLIWLTLLTLALTACAEGGWGKRETGAVIGGVGGGVLGSQFGRGSGKTAATIAGVLLGGMLGGYIGEQMDQNDRYRMNQAFERNRDFETSRWRSDTSGRGYEVTPGRPFRSQDFDTCREFTQKVFVDGRQETAYGTACRQSDGSWRIVESR